LTPTRRCWEAASRRLTSSGQKCLGRTCLSPPTGTLFTMYGTSNSTKKQGCGSGLDPDPGARKWKNFSGKMHFLVIKIKLPLKRYKIALTTFWQKFWWIPVTPVFLIWFNSNFDFKKIWEGNCFRKFYFSLDPELDPAPDWAKMLDPDPHWSQPCKKEFKN
jgi:hypothetical protein